MLIAIELLFIAFLVIILFMIFKNEGLAAKSRLRHARIEECWRGKDRRRHPRFAQSLGVVYSIPKKQTACSVSGKTIDISEGGVKLFLDEKLSPGASVNLKISIPASGGTATITGYVVWTEEAVNAEDSSGKRFFYSGIKFSSLNNSPCKTLTDYIFSLPLGQEG